MPEGLVMRSTGSWYEVRSEEQEIIQCRLRGKLKMQDLKVTNPVAVGDRIEYDLEKDPGKGIINTILPRDNYIIRRSVHKAAFGHIIAANIDQALLIVTLTFPKTSLGFIDRFLVTAESFRIPTVLVFNKIDLLTEEAFAYQQELAEMYAHIGYSSLFTSVVEQKGIAEVKAILDNKKTLVSGHSGVGKSSLVNQLAPQLDLRTNEVSTFANKGVHTTTFAEMFEIIPNTFIIDTPGIKELGLVDTEKWEISHYFPEMRDLLNQCRFHNCTHLHEPGCAVLEAVEQGTIAASRFSSYVSMAENFDNRR
jgi:ribosome biogenesis GTPase